MYICYLDMLSKFSKLILIRDDNYLDKSLDRMYFK